MFSAFFFGLQRDFWLFWLPPAICAIFRLIFIWRFSPVPLAQRLENKKPLYECFRYGFWWGMDFNAYVFLFLLLFVSLPGAFFPAYFALGDTVRLVLVTLYCLALYFAFMAKMIFYYHYRDIFNHLVFLGKNADKNNLLDIFFHQNHGGLILAFAVVFAAFCAGLCRLLLAIPGGEWPAFSGYLAPIFQFGVVAAAIAFFYWCRYGGTFKHADKPEWDEIPSCVKKDIFLAKATVDDFCALEMLWLHPLNELRQESDEIGEQRLKKILPAPWPKGENPLFLYRRKAAGARIKKPKHIFFLFAESYGQALFDAPYDELHLVDAGKAFRANEKTLALDHFLPGGEISQPSLASLLSGIYDAGLELNEDANFWQKTLPTAWPVQFKRLGYKTVFWYGGPLNWGSLLHYLPACGFDAAMDAFEFCPPESPRSWLGIWDGVFLAEAAKNIEAMDDAEPVLHFLYTTSNHGPYRIPLDEVGYSPEKIMPHVPPALKSAKAVQAGLGTYWYTDQAMAEFISRMQSLYPDSLIVVTGDHPRRTIPFGYGLTKRSEETLRELYLTAFHLHHRELSPAWFKGKIGGHLHILPTLIELIAPQGFSYYSLFPSLFEPIDHVVTPHSWLTAEEIGHYQEKTGQKLAVSREELPLTHYETPPFWEEREGLRSLSGWLARHPELLKTKEELSGE